MSSCLYTEGVGILCTHIHTYVYVGVQFTKKKKNKRQNYEKYSNKLREILTICLDCFVSSNIFSHNSYEVS